MNVSNLDAACAKLGHELGTMVAKGKKPKDTENSLTKALGVLEAQGVYALFLYLHAREKKLGGLFSEKLMAFLRERVPGSWGDTRDNEPFGALQALAENLDDLLFARDLLHQVLVYARYHAKAAQAAGAGASASGGRTRTSRQKGPLGGGRNRPRGEGGKGGQQGRTK